jgi:uncharacterized protein (DUF58 family)
MVEDGIRLGSRQIYILPTRHGLLFSLVLLALLLASVNYANALAYLLTFLLASMAIVSVLHAQRNLLRLHVSAAAGEPVFAEEPVQFRICLRNEGAARYALRVESRDGAVQPFDVPARDTRCVMLAAPTARRGWLDCPAFTLASFFPLGITRVWCRRLRPPVRVLVYPRPADEATLEAVAGNEGESLAGTQQGGEDFTGLRAYQQGDLLTRISWKALARGRGLHTKEFSTPLAEILWLDWEAFAPHDTEARLRMLCRALLDADTAGLRFGLRLPGVTLQPDDSPEHRRRCLEALALHEDRG